MATLQKSVGTDPGSKPVPIPPDMVPFVVGQARVACGEIRIVAESIQRDCESRELREQAQRLQQQAIRLGQAANAISAVEINGIALLHIDPRASLKVRIKAAIQLCWKLISYTSR